MPAGIVAAAGRCYPALTAGQVAAAGPASRAGLAADCGAPASTVVICESCGGQLGHGDVTMPPKGGLAQPPVSP